VSRSDEIGYNRENMLKRFKLSSLPTCGKFEDFEMIQQKVVYDKRKEHANGDSLNEYDWNSGEKRRS